MGRIGFGPSTKQTSGLAIQVAAWVWILRQHGTANSFRMVGGNAHMEHLEGVEDETEGRTENLVSYMII